MKIDPIFGSNITIFLKFYIFMYKFLHKIGNNILKKIDYLRLLLICIIRVKMEENEKPYRWWREEIGGLWEKIGELQFNFLVKNGLEPKHFLLDIGCGSLRGGIHFIRFLEECHYFGIDKNQELRI